MRVLYKGDFLSLSGYSRATRNHARALIEVGVEVQGITQKHDLIDVKLDPWWQEHMGGVLSTSHTADICLHQSTPEFYNPSPAQYNIAMLAWETDTIPNYDVDGDPRNNWVKQLNRMDEIWTFASFMVEVLHKSGVREDIPVTVIPHPIDTSIYCPGDKAELFDSHRKSLNGCFKFLFVGQWSKRKDPYTLLTAFMSEFSAKENVCLILKTYGPDFGPQAKEGLIKQYQMFKMYMRNPKGLPRVLFQLEQMGDAEMPGLLRAADINITASCGEGFGLPTVESMACGVPPIVPLSSSFRDLVTPDRGWLCTTHPTPVAGMIFKWYETYMNWWAVDIPHMMRNMREAYEREDYRKAMAENGIEWVKKNLSFSNIGAIMKSRLEEIEANARA